MAQVFPFPINAQGDTIDVEMDNALGSEVGVPCLAGYFDEFGNFFSFVPGIALTGSNIWGGGPECIPISKAEWAVIDEINKGNVEMANWILVSQIDLQNRIDAQTFDIVQQVTNAAGGSGGFTDADRNLLNVVNSRLNSIDSRLNTMEFALSSTLNNIDTKLVIMSSNMDIDHDVIMSELISGGGLTEEGLLSGIGTLLDGVSSWLEVIVGDFTEAISNIGIFADTLIASIEQSFATRMSEVAATLSSTMSFMSSEMFAGFNTIVDAVQVSLSALGNITDFLTIDFMDMWASTFEFSETDAKDVATTLLDTFKEIVGAYSTVLPQRDDS